MRMKRVSSFAGRTAAISFLRCFLSHSSIDIIVLLFYSVHCMETSASCAYYSVLKMI